MDSGRLHLASDAMDDPLTPNADEKSASSVEAVCPDKSWDPTKLSWVCDLPASIGTADPSRHAKFTS